MCGIAGIFGFSNQEPVDAAPLRAAMDAMALRGPDEHGLYEAPGTALGHRRLSVIDLQGGHQPFTDSETGNTIVYNGEIYNFPDLRRTLSAHGYTFQTHSDTEVLLKAYRHWGVECLQHLNGMFAFALFDPAAQTLFAARDRLGVKPFFYTSSNGCFQFASTIAALLKLAPERHVLNHAAAAHYLTTIRTTLEDQTLLEGVYSLQPGRYLLLHREQAMPRPGAYWQIPILAPHEKDSTPTQIAAAGIHALLEDSVRLRLISDVPLGGFLSGGLDSTILAALASRLTNGNYNAYSVGYNREGFHEWPFIEEACRRYAMHCRQIHLDAATYPNDWQFLIREKGLPLSTPNEVPIYHLAHALRNDFTVALSGEGADEIFGGYTIPYFSSFDFDRAANPNRNPAHPLTDALRRLYGTDTFPDHVTHHFLLNSWMPAAAQHELAPLLTPGYENMLARYAERYESLTRCSTLDKHMHVHAAVNLEGLLFRMDASTMAASVEARVPFTDYRIVERLFTLPDTCKIDWASDAARLRADTLNILEIDRENLLVSKLLLREAFRHEVPPSILDRRKMSFPVPFMEWFSSDLNTWINQTIQSSPWYGDLFNRDAVDALIAHAQEPRSAMHLWPLANLCLWQQQFNISLE